jgi:hypothetical protein
MPTHHNRRLQTAIRRLTGLLGIGGLLILAGCSVPGVNDDRPTIAWTTTQVDDLIARHAPVITVSNDWASWNRPGSAEVRRDWRGDYRVSIDPTRPSLYVEKRGFNGQSGRRYTNLIYRMHFERVPMSYWPLHITTGPNGGVMVLVTLDDEGQPLLYTTVHTCGCYIAFIPTTSLADSALPDDWPTGSQQVFGIELPAKLPARDNLSEDADRIMVAIRGDEHRVVGVDWADEMMIENDYDTREIRLLPMTALDALIDEDGQAQSFFISEGKAAGWVRDTRKPLEFALMSWWTFDPRIGVDKRYGEPAGNSPQFYTSIKPWNRTPSDMRDFPGFLAFWGWQL